MIQLNQLKLKINHTEEDLRRQILNALRIKEDALLSYNIRKQSIDARKKPELFFVYTIDVSTKSDLRILKSSRCKTASIVKESRYHFKPSGTLRLSHRPVVIGSGPAGLFCAYMLSAMGYRPILLERGMPVEERIQDVAHFWDTGALKPNSNVQFGEGGAGTFSDGKLNTLVKDGDGRNRKVLELFVAHGAPKEILYMNKPHIGTDILTHIVKDMRAHIIAQGGAVYFHTQMTDIHTVDGHLCGLYTKDTLTGEERYIDTEAAVLAIGHSARDTFETLSKRNIPMEAKSFAVGVRVEHPQTLINQSQYGLEHPAPLQAASYKLTCNLPDNRGVYTFCMCPGGYVVNASSEAHRLAVNGMSYHDRAGANANSAVIVTVTPEDFQQEGPLAGIAFQRELEETAYRIGNGKVPVQLFEDFCTNTISTKLGSLTPQIKGTYTLSNVRCIFPEEIASSIEQGIKAFGQKMRGFADGHVLVSGVESRTSSPVRIVRGENMESICGGLYPCGEGAGYAGGITSAAMDGIKVAEAIAKKYRKFDIDG